MKALVTVLLLMAPVFASAAEVRGPVIHVVDGDTIDIAAPDKKRIRLWGIDTPERGQTCQGRTGETYQCGRDAKAVLTEITRGKTLICTDQVPQKTPNRGDLYGRMIGVCRDETGLEINETMIRRGWAVPEAHAGNHYDAAEQAAKREGLGLHAGRFETPKTYRHRRALESLQRRLQGQSGG